MATEAVPDGQDRSRPGANEGSFLVRRRRWQLPFENPPCGLNYPPPDFVSRALSGILVLGGIYEGVSWRVRGLLQVRVALLHQSSNFLPSIRLLVHSSPGPASFIPRSFDLVPSLVRSFTALCPREHQRLLHE